MAVTKTMTMTVGMILTTAETMIMGDGDETDDGDNHDGGYYDEEEDRRG